MDKLTDFKPIRRLDLPELENLQCQGLVVVVGPNSSGKSQLLRDIRDKISGEPRKLVVAVKLDIESPDLDPFLKCLRAEGYIYSTWDDNDQEQLVPMTTFLGTGRAGQNVHSNQLQQWQGRSAQAESKNRKNEYFGWTSAFLVTALFLENRLTHLQSTKTIDFEKQAPQQDLHALHLSDNARQSLTNEIRRAFSKGLWSDTSRGSVICLRVSDDGQVPDADARLSPKTMSTYRTLESEGDGMKSYAATAVTLLLGRRPVTVIDEPELCLHPPQAYNLGQFIGREATSPQTTTFIATHSSQILRGIIQTASNLQIVRLTRSKVGFRAKRVEANVLATALRKPTVRAETVLDGIFSQAVAIVEADGDRIVYQAAWERVGGPRNFDIHFATVGGTGGIADTCQLYKILGIPIAIIADIDLITDIPRLRQVVTSICSDTSRTESILSVASRVAEQIKRLPPTISESDAVRKLTELSSAGYSWANGDDLHLSERLSALTGALSRMRRLKSGGVRALPLPLAAEIEVLLSTLSKEGLFIVPVGELEEWLSSCNISASKKKKWAWANEAAEYIRTQPVRTDDIWAFVVKLGDFLTEQFN